MDPCMQMAARIYIYIYYGISRRGIKIYKVIEPDVYVFLAFSSFDVLSTCIQPIDDMKNTQFVDLN